MTKCIVLTGGGTAGHVTPNIALMTSLQQTGWRVHYIGSETGVEQQIMKSYDLPYYAISCGKLRRYFSLKTLLEPFHILKGIVQSYRILHRIKPNVVFSKGGFVAFPVVVAAWLNRIPVIVHESDMTPGLANRLSFPFATKIFVAFEKTVSLIKRPAEVTGTPIRQELLQGCREKGLALCGFSSNKPCLLIIGGSLGASVINQCIRQSLDDLCNVFQVIHICGKGKVDASLSDKKNYRQFEYVSEELPHLMAASDVVVSRAGANSVCEILALGKAHVFVPLSKRVSRGDQVENAQFFQELGVSIVVDEESLNQETLKAAIQSAYANQDEIVKKIKELPLLSKVDQIVDLITQTSNSSAKK